MESFGIYQNRKLANQSLVYTLRMSIFYFIFYFFALLGGENIF